MKDAVVYECPEPRRRLRPAQWMTPAVVLLMAAVMVGEWACAPRQRPAAAQPAPAAFVPAAVADTPPPAPAPVQVTPPQTQPAPATVAQLDRELAASVAEERATPAAIAAATAAAFPVRRRMEMSSTMYCLKGQMRTGVRTRDGMAAGDPSVLPLGSVVRVSHPDGRPIGIFVIMDTGGAIRGNKIDIYVDSCREAEDWGRRPVVAEVLDIGRA